MKIAAIGLVLAALLGPTAAASAHPPWVAGARPFRTAEEHRWQRVALRYWRDRGRRAARPTAFYRAKDISVYGVPAFGYWDPRTSAIYVWDQSDEEFGCNVAVHEYGHATGLTHTSRYAIMRDPITYVARCEDW